VVVDDGSTDSSPDIIASYGNRVRSLRQSNAGVAAARNAAIGASEGELIAFLDQDDWWLPEKTARQARLFAADEQIGLVHTDIAQYSEVAAAIIDGVYDTSKSAALQGDCYDTLLLGNGVFNSSVVIRRSVLATSGVFDPGIPGNTVQDYDLWLRIAQCSRFGYIAESLTVLRLHAEQGTWNRRAMLSDELSLLERRLAKDALRATPAMRVRVARLLDALGVAHLDADTPGGAARHCFGRALRTCWSWRAALLYALCFLPPAGIAWVRQQRARLRGRGDGAARAASSFRHQRSQDVTKARP
jgi:glycosyltransferase involved in cell wall biosynthesis